MHLYTAPMMLVSMIVIAATVLTFFLKTELRLGNARVESMGREGRGEEEDVPERDIEPGILM